jgi:hypothetical protein
MKKELVHPQWGKEILVSGIDYVPEEAEVLPYLNKEILCIKGIIANNVCCGTAIRNYIQAQGFLLSKNPWQNAYGDTVSEIETITGENDRHAIRELLEAKYPAYHIEIL